MRALVHGRAGFVWAIGLLLVIPIADNSPGSVKAAYDHAHQLFLQGDLIRSQQEAEQGYLRFLDAKPEWAAKFLLLDAQALIFRGMNEDALRVLAAKPFILRNREAIVEGLALEGVANTYLARYPEAERKLADARNLCNGATDAVCNRVIFRRALLALTRGQFSEARYLFLENLSLARAANDRRSEASALLNLGAVCLQSGRYDEAVDWSWSAYRSANELSAGDLSETAMGNLGWAYYQLGDKEKALDLLLQAEKTASRLGSIRNEIWLVSTAGYVYRDQGDLSRASQAYRQSLQLAKLTNSRQDIINALEDLAHTDVMGGKLDEAAVSLDQLDPLVHASGSRVDALDVMLARGEIAAARRQDQQAESIFRTVEHDPASQTSMRLGAEHQLARLYEAQGNTAIALDTYRTALTTFEAARNDLKNEESKLPFLTNATPIYDDYIHLLVKQGRTDEALAAADQSRARTLAQGLELASGKSSLKPAAFHAGEVARKTGSTVLFYWLGEQQSYLWAITPNKTSLFPLPPQREITTAIERYRKELLEPAIARDAAYADGAALFRMLVAPAAAVIAPGGNVVVVSDGALSLLNFETLIVPLASSSASPHYWIEDANIVSAPSLHMLAAAKASSATNKKLLLMGDAVSPNPDYPELPMARAEIEKIGKHFAPADRTVFERLGANSAAYLKTSLRDYAYIHFVAHGVASRTDPLDSAIILSRTGAADDSFKLHAREIIQHPIDARLVTISACYGGGTRSYAGEGLVGLSWAFLRAGAHNVIGALWEASDDSTPQLMDKMYAGLADGMTPSAALRQAKLSLLHSEGKFRQPFYWAPFQIYAGL
jgi:CHAT domain-containing protein/Tfp pilus assembly protein PilF